MNVFREDIYYSLSLESEETTDLRNNPSQHKGLNMTQRTLDMSAMKPLVLLIGPNGFVGAHVLDLLLKNNYRVRGTVRSLSKATYFQNKYPEASSSGCLTFVAVPDIQAPGSLDEAANGVDYICHVASPYFTSSNDPIRELVEPAVNGTRNVVSSALKSKTLKRMTIMSSFASVVDLSKNPRGGYTYTAEDWDPVTPEEAAKDGFTGYPCQQDVCGASSLGHVEGSKT